MIARREEPVQKHAPEYRGGEWWCHGKPMWRPKSQPFTRVCVVRKNARSTYGVWSLRELRKLLEDECDVK